MRSKSSTWFNVRVAYQKTMEDGSEKVVKENYVVDSISFSETENKSIDELSVYVSGEFKILAESKANFDVVFFSDKDDDDSWFKAKLQFITIDEKTEKEKRSNAICLVQAKSLARALRYIDEVMCKTMTDYNVVGLNLTNIIDVFEHNTADYDFKKMTSRKNEQD